MGKTALLQDLVASKGSGVRVLRTQGVESEAPLAFAAGPAAASCAAHPRAAAGFAGSRVAGLMGAVNVDFAAENPGPWMVRCLNLHHAEAGMMTRLDYLT